MSGHTPERIETKTYEITIAALQPKRIKASMRSMTIKARCLSKVQAAQIMSAGENGSLVAASTSTAAPHLGRYPNSD